MARASNPRDWHDLTPALGMLVGVALALLAGVLLPDAVGALGVFIAFGGALGLVIGSVVWVLHRRS